MSTTPAAPQLIPRGLPGDDRRLDIISKVSAPQEADLGESGIFNTFKSGVCWSWGANEMRLLGALGTAWSGCSCSRGCCTQGNGEVSCHGDRSSAPPYLK